FGQEFRHIRAVLNNVSADVSSVSHKRDALMAEHWGVSWRLHAIGGKESKFVLKQAQIHVRLGMLLLRTRADANTLPNSGLASRCHPKSDQGTRSESKKNSSDVNERHD